MLHLIGSYELSIITLVCINIGEYRKCVTFGRDGPLELESVTKQVFLSIESMGRKQDQAR